MLTTEVPPPSPCLWNTKQFYSQERRRCSGTVGHLGGPGHRADSGRVASLPLAPRNQKEKTDPTPWKQTPYSFQ